MIRRPALCLLMLAVFLPVGGCHVNSVREVLTEGTWTRRNIHGVPVQSEPEVTEADETDRQE